MLAQFTYGVAAAYSCIRHACTLNMNIEQASFIRVMNSNHESNMGHSKSVPHKDLKFIFGQSLVFLTFWLTEGEGQKGRSDER